MAKTMGKHSSFELMVYQSSFEVATGFLQLFFHHKRIAKENWEQSEIQNCFIQLLELEFKCFESGVADDMKIGDSTIWQAKLESWFGRIWCLPVRCIRNLRMESKSNAGGNNFNGTRIAFPDISLIKLRIWPRNAVKI